MNPLNNPTEYMKIDEAARFLRVNRRTIYRRIWSGDLPASKVGGLYYIKRDDLEMLLAEGRVKPRTEAEPETSALTQKCGNCFRLLVSESQIGETCQEAGCERVICTQCQSDGVYHCIQHAPDQAGKWEEAVELHQQGEIPILIRDSSARLRELNFLNRIQNRIARINTMIHPLSGETVTISNWDDLLVQGDERVEVMRLLGKVMLDKNTLAKVPVNAYLHYRIPSQTKGVSLSLEIYVKSLSRLPVMLRDGFDTQQLNADDLTPWVTRLSEEVQRSQVFRMIVLASTTGWDASTREVIQGDSTGKPGNGSAYAHPMALFYLYDLEQGELLFNQQDERARQYAELFVPLLLSEELEEVTKDIENELITHDSLTLSFAAQTLPYSQDLLKQAFERMAENEDYTLIEDAELGMVIMRQ